MLQVQQVTNQVVEENSMEKETKKAIYNLQRFQILQTKMNSNTSDLIPDHYAYAWYRNLYPLMDESQITRDLEDCFEDSKKQIDKVLEWSDEEYGKGIYHTFYEYEEQFGARYSNPLNISRSSLISIFRYCYLSDTFDKKFWEKLLEPKNHPSESITITRKFNIQDISLC